MIEVKIFEKAKLKVIIGFIIIIFCVATVKFWMSNSFALPINVFETAIESQAGINELKSDSFLKEAGIFSKNSWILIIIIVVAVLLMILLFYLILRNIVNNNRHKEELKESRHKIVEHGKMQETFFTNMIHEIRTPLTGIIGFTDQLLQTKMDKEQEKYMMAVHKSSEHLLNVVNDILDFSKIEAKKLKIESTGFTVSDVVREVITTMKNFAESKNLSLYSKIEANLSEQIMIGDPFRIKQILLNLVNNSIKFTEKGKVEISCSMTEGINKDCLLKMEVYDTGIGISHHEIKNVFDEFSLVFNNTGRKFGGAGLGLSISKKLTDLQGGSIFVKSKINVGSVFTVVIPCKKGEITDIPIKLNYKPIKITPFPTAKNVLLADDDTISRLLVKTILNKYKINADEAEDGKGALDLLSSKDYDLIITDIHMPDISGIDLAKQIRMLTNTSKAAIPIMLLTASIIKEDNKCFEAGINDYIIKPFKENIFCEKVFKNLDIQNVFSIKNIDKSNSKNSVSMAHSEEVYQAFNINSQFKC